MRVFIINLEKDSERRLSILQQCKDLNIEAEIIPAVDGRTLSHNELEKITHPSYVAGLTPSEIGCSLSHLKIYKKMANENIEKALILEDDALLKVDLVKIVEWYNNIENKSEEVILLSEVNKYFTKPIKKINEDYHLVDVAEAALTHCYLLNKKAAIKLLDFLTPVWLEADRWTFIREYSIVSLKAIVPRSDYNQRSAKTLQYGMIRNKLKKERDSKKQVNNIKKNKKRKTIIIKGQDIPMENNKKEI
ncbi:glycosyltransferase family 25 protein [Tatumella ptyseos]|uniref:Glycosyltransferase family 25 (LPS biosynthesis protein) n=1 Tax=Tatumella ptyseos TaxID=82987 RepID=A0A2X5PUX6_9GAMM|nr:glycosyltransferase family 25 protein [Tatumella ptyseos]SQK76910.1 Glycosyltransferase family 25 (LPS biosynthesis protein) [Tatumella ptyseos]